MLRIHRKVGQKSRTAGIALAIFSLAFLGLSLYFSENIVFQIDSIVCLLAAIALFLRGERNSIQVRIVNRMLESSNQVLDELSSLSFGRSTTFTYNSVGDKIGDVVVVAGTEIRHAAELETTTTGESTLSPRQSNVLERSLVPPGRSLAELYQRELNMTISTELLVQSLQTVICERFELASLLSVKQPRDSGSYEILLSRPAVRQSSGTGDSTGIIGCPLSSMLAILFCYASKQPVRLQQSTFDIDKNELKIFLGFANAES